MVSTRAGGSKQPGEASQSVNKRSAPSKAKPVTKKAKKEKDGKLQVGNGGEVGLKQDDKDDEHKGDGNEENNKDGEVEVDRSAAPVTADDKDPVTSDKEDEELGVKRSGPGETRQEGDETTIKEQEDSTGTELDEPKHGTLESGHIYFMYRPKIDADEVEGIDDISKFHMLLIPTSAPHDKGHYHRIIEVGKKKMPDPDARYQVIWGLVGSVGTDQGALKQAFGAYSYETKTRGTRHQSAARPAARGHYILHSPRDEVADHPDHDRQRDFKCLLAYEITTPAPEDFGHVQTELGLAPKGAVVLQVKDPNVQSNNNPRAASIPRERRAQYPPRLMSLFNGRRFIAANPPSFISYPGTEVLILTSPHKLSDSLGKDGERVEHDMDEAAGAEAVNIEASLKELGMTKKDTQIEALEGAWA